MSRTERIPHFRVSPEEKARIINASSRFSSMREFVLKLVDVYEGSDVMCPLVKRKDDISWERVVRKVSE